MLMLYTVICTYLSFVRDCLRSDMCNNNVDRTNKVTELTLTSVQHATDNDCRILRWQCNSAVPKLSLQKVSCYTSYYTQIWSAMSNVMQTTRMTRNLWQTWAKVAGIISQGEREQSTQCSADVCAACVADTRDAIVPETTTKITDTLKKASSFQLLSHCS